MNDPCAFHREISTTDLSREGRHFNFTASDEECRAIAEFLGIYGLQSLSAKLKVKRWRKQGVMVEGDVSAQAVQECVVTLAPVVEDIAEHMSLRFDLQGARRRSSQTETDQEIFFDPDAADPPELFEGPLLDLGPYLVEFVAVGLDPYPKAPGAELTQSEFPAQDKTAAGRMSGQKDNPFHVLRHLKKDDAK